MDSVISYQLDCANNFSFLQRQPFWKRDISSWKRDIGSVSERAFLLVYFRAERSADINVASIKIQCIAVCCSVL